MRPTSAVCSTDYSTKLDPLKQNLIAVNTDVEHIFRDVSFVVWDSILRIESYDGCS